MVPQHSAVPALVLHDHPIQVLEQRLTDNIKQDEKDIGAKTALKVHRSDLGGA